MSNRSAVSFVVATLVGFACGGSPDVEIGGDENAVSPAVSGGGGSLGRSEAGASAEICGDGRDNDDNGKADEGCPCAAGTTQPCFIGDPKLAGVGACTLGTQSCVGAGELGSSWGECTGYGKPDATGGGCGGSPAPSPKPQCIEGAPGAATKSPWQKWLDPKVHCMGRSYDHDPKEFSFSAIPDPADAKWQPVPQLTIDFSDPTTIKSSDQCGGSRWGSVFTYFQTDYTLPAGFQPKSFVVRIGSSDDGVRAWINGESDAKWTAFDGGGTFDLTAKLKPGPNRVVLVHVDDNPSSRRLTGVSVELDGAILPLCP